MYQNNKMKNDWKTIYSELSKNDEDLNYPSETLVRLIKGNYININKINLKNKKILDVGFGNGNNLSFLCSLSNNVYGVEIEKSICKFVKQKLKKKGFKPNISIGSNSNLPFKKNYFDLLISWNVLHYEGSVINIQKSIEEYFRVLKKDGILLISTTGPEHKILKNAKTLDNHIYKIRRPGDLRKDQKHFFFDNERYINYYFNKYFSIKIGRIQDNLISEKLDWWIIYGRKKFVQKI